MKKLLLAMILVCFAFGSYAQSWNNKNVNGYRPIWFDLGQKSEYGSKYSGGLGTYTVKHSPLAIYAPEVDKTFFVYGGTTKEKERYLLCMIGCFDHKTGMVSRPRVVYDKMGIVDPHDNPAILIDDEGYLWIYISGRGNARPGFRYRSTKPYDISEFEMMNSSIMAYPQPRYVKGEGHFLFFTRYDGVRQTFFQTSPDGKNWSEHKQLASIIAKGEKHSGHYQVVGQHGKKLVTAFNRHINGSADGRTNLYYIQTEDFGKTWTLADGTPIEIPITDENSPCKIRDVEHNKQFLFVKDVNFDSKGNPVILYLTSYGFRPGPKSGPREWFVAHWAGKKWLHHPVTTSSHCYDSGSLFIEDGFWRIIVPTADGPQRWGTGGEIISWVSKNNGKSWKMEREYTKDSPRNHGYVRRALDAKDPFYCFWADGNPDVFSISYLYMGDSKGNVYRLPYSMKTEWAKPELYREVSN